MKNAPAPKPVKLSFWQRRFVERHYRSASDAALASAMNVSPRAVGEHLGAVGAVRRGGDEKKIAAGKVGDLPDFFTPGRALKRAMHIDTRSLDRRDRVLIAGMFLVSVVLYGLTAARTVTGEDAGELLAAAHELGVPHPPGYPLWTLIAYCFDHAVSWGTVAWRVSMVSAVFAAGANALLLAIGLKTLRSRVAATFGAGLFAVSLTHWSQAVIPEVYGLSTFFVTASVLLWIRLAETPSAGRLIALAGVTGLACTNHTTAFVVGLLVAIAAVAAAPQLLKSPKAVAGALVAGVLPLSLYLLLPVFSAANPYVDWGNPETMDALWDHVSRAQYAASEAAQGAVVSQESYFRRLSILGEGAGQQFGNPLVLALAVAGFVVLLARQTGLALLLIGVAWSCSVGITQYTQYDLGREHVYANQIFFIPAWLCLAAFIGAGADAALGAVRDARGLQPRLASVLGPFAVAAVICLPLVRHYDQVDRSQTTLVSDYGKALLDSMEPGALYFPAADHSTFAVMYWQGVEKYRTDVALADRYGRLEQEILDACLTDGDYERAASEAQQVGARRALENALVRAWDGPVYFAGRREMDGLEPRSLLPVGTAFQVMEPDEAEAWHDVTAVRADWLALEQELNIAASARHPDLTVQMIVGDFLFAKGVALLELGADDDALAVWRGIQSDVAPIKQILNNIASTLAERGRAEASLEFYDKALKEDESYVTALRNVASVYERLDRVPEAEATLRRLAEVDDSVPVRVRLAEFLAGHARVEDALLECEAAALASPRESLPWRTAATILEQAGDLAKAEEALERCLKLAPSDSDAASALERVRMKRARPSAGGSVATPNGPTMPDVAGARPSIEGVKDVLRDAMPVVPSPMQPVRPSLSSMPLNAAGLGMPRTNDIEAFDSALRDGRF